MSEATTFRVDLRGSTLADAAPLSGGERAPFLGLERPPPVRSVLTLTGADARARAFEVSSVVEQEREDRPRGCFGRWCTLDELAHGSTIGSENLAPMRSVVAAPSPVVDSEESGIVAQDVHEGGTMLASQDVGATADDRHGESAGADERESTEGSADDDDGEARDSGEPDIDLNKGPRGKKRKPRNRG